MVTRRDEAMVEALAAVAPGRPLREGVDRIILANKGALIVVGDTPEVLAICSGGLLIDAEYTPQRLSELAKMDGAIILNPDATRIARANVHLVPNPNVPTVEAGTRHRTAERVARSIDVPVISVSEDLSIIAVYRANQALSTLERYKARLDAVSGSLNALEVEDLVTVRDVASVLQRAEMVRRIAEEIDGYTIELGVDGRLVLLQLEELMGGVEDDRRWVMQDYVIEGARWSSVQALAALTELQNEDLLEASTVAGLLHLPSDLASLDSSVSPRGYRFLSKVPRIPESVVENLVVHFGSLQKVMRAAVAELDDVAGVGHVRAKAVKEGLSRLAETSILDRYS
jgi:diadenylate cyclase